MSIEHYITFSVYLTCLILFSYILVCFLIDNILNNLSLSFITFHLLVLWLYSGLFIQSDFVATVNEICLYANINIAGTAA